MTDKFKILIVDDDEAIRDSYSRLLGQDYRVEVAEGPESAQRVIQADPLYLEKRCQHTKQPLLILQDLCRSILWIMQSALMFLYSIDVLEYK